jgi:hypothetical protein
MTANRNSYEDTRRPSQKLSTVSAVSSVQHNLLQLFRQQRGSACSEKRKQSWEGGLFDERDTHCNSRHEPAAALRLQETLICTGHN